MPEALPSPQTVSWASPGSRDRTSPAREGVAPEPAQQQGFRKAAVTP